MELAFSSIERLLSSSKKTERIEDKMPKKINHTLLLSAAINNTYIHRTVCVAGDTWP